MRHRKPGSISWIAYAGVILAAFLCVMCLSTKVHAAEQDDTLVNNNQQDDNGTGPPTTDINEGGLTGLNNTSDEQGNGEEGSSGADGTTNSVVKTTYNYNAELFDTRAGVSTPDGEVRPGGELPGVYVVDNLQPNATGQNTGENASGESQSGEIPSEGDQTDANASEGNQTDGNTSEGSQTNENTAEVTQTIGIPSIADANLADAPTKKSPAIIQGAAVGYEEKTGAVSYKQYVSEEEIPEPYASYRYTITQQQAADGTMVDKLTGFDQSYYIVRLDVSEFLTPSTEADQSTTDQTQDTTDQSQSSTDQSQSSTDQSQSSTDQTQTTTDQTQIATDQVQATTKYLHIKQEDNRALIPGFGFEQGIETAYDYNKALANGGESFTDQVGGRTASYSLDYLIKKSTVSGTVEKPYVDILLFAGSSIVAGADAGKTQTPTGDIKLSMYVDEILDYNPDMKYDAQSTDPQKNITDCLAKFFDTTKTTVDKISHYLVKGSDLKIETAVEKDDTKFFGEDTQYWSLNKSFENSYYDRTEDASADDTGCGETVVLISEVAITDNLDLVGTDTKLRKRTLDVNSFDVQVASNSNTSEDPTTNPDGFMLQNAWLTIKDGTATTGSEVAIGNNAQFTINNGGRLIIDESCQLEIEWDGASTTPGTEPAPAQDPLNNGKVDLNKDGTLVNNGVISIEGFEGKPHAEGTQPIDPTGCGEMVIEEGATLINNGCFVVNGRLYVLGKLVNNGRYNDTISSMDPDKGRFDYHKGIQLSFKDDVSQTNYKCGEMLVGVETGTSTGVVNNYGDIVLVPGNIYNYSSIVNGVNATDKKTGTIYMAAATEYIKPIEPATPSSTIVTVRTKIDPPTPSTIDTSRGTISGDGKIIRAYVKLNDNIGLGAMTTYDEVEAVNGRYEMKNYDGYVIPTDPVPEEDEEPAPVEEEKKEQDSAPSATASDNLVILEIPAGNMNVNGKTVAGPKSVVVFNDNSFGIKVEEGFYLSGKLRLVGNELRFVLGDGTVIRPTIDANGNYVYTITLSSGRTITFVLKRATVLKMFNPVI